MKLNLAISFIIILLAVVYLSVVDSRIVYVAGQCPRRLCRCIEYDFLRLYCRKRYSDYSGLLLQAYPVCVTNDHRYEIPAYCHI